MTEQHQLFDTEPEPWEADDQSRQWVASVVVSAGTARESDYLVPDALRETVELGRRVKVPLGSAIGWSSAIACGWKIGRPAAGV